MWEVGSFLLHPPTESNGAEHKEEEQEGNKEETRRDPAVFNTISSPAQRLIRTFLSNSFIYFLRDCRGNEKEAHMKITTSEINVLSLLLTPPYLRSVRLVLKRLNFYPFFDEYRLVVCR